MLPRIWKKNFNREVVIPMKMRFCNECNDKINCDRCISQVEEKKISKPK